MIPRLFAGAEAELALVEGEEGVGGGVEIFVRLPGKKLESVSLLSGGEKALVSIALLFAIFEANPGPFCILDEVDAPLDDANVARFSELVRAIAARAQVLVVTHNKKTMLAADRLYGVTMQTPGISTVLSVSLS
jgi:chromosome segregation protein